MIGSDAYNYINVLDKAADASWVRNEVIANNIANVDTPGFKRKDVVFESYLQQSLSGKGSFDEKVRDINLSGIKPSVYTDYAQLSYRYDDNNVDISTESANLAENQIRYYTLLESMSQEFSRIKTALTVK
ncbi:MAG: flagellar basal body rod protein FlgB [Lachnospiraceae bacterium]|nr:flagellar basal body rod protein FlgB [Lachnospiraceae bacterium]MBP5185308.1 flagellar basal body rod protein FlgB [Lachnospiraceae bacterium]